MPDPSEFTTIPGNLVFSRRMVLQALQPSGPLPPGLCPPAESVLSPTVVLRLATFRITEIVGNPTDLLRGPNFPDTETFTNPTVVLSTP